MTDHNSAYAPQLAPLSDCFYDGTTRSLTWRSRQLRQLEKMLTIEDETFIRALADDLGKSAVEAHTTEIGFVLAEARLARRKLKRWSAKRPVPSPLITQPARSYLLPQPLGLCLIISPWNYPLVLALGPLVAAIAAGNTAVIKPSELAGATAEAIATLLPMYLDTRAFAVIQGDGAATSELLKARFAHIFYTGGANVARHVMTAAAKHLTPVTLELGGKSPCIVLEDANIQVAASRIVWSKWMNAGQTCVAPDYVLVAPQIRERLIDAIINKIEAFYGADASASPDYGRIINERHFRRLTGYLKQQDVRYGGKSDLQTRFLGPTLVVNPAADSSLMQEEIFGPILPIIDCVHLEFAISHLREQEAPLALYLFSRSAKAKRQVLTQTRSGSVCINDGMMFMANPNLPFGGLGLSGMGSYHGRAGFDNFSHLKAVMERPTWLDISLRYPPFTPLKARWLKKLMGA